MTKEELKKWLKKENAKVIIALAQQLEIDGRSSMKKAERIDAIIKNHEVTAIQKALRITKYPTLIQRIINFWRKLTWKKITIGVVTLLAIIGHYNNVVDLVHEKWGIVWDIVEEFVMDTSKSTATSTPIFNDASKDSLFKILIVPFENRRSEEKENAECIGEAIYTYLEDQLKTNDSIPIWVEYADSIKPPRKAEKAINLRKKHKADLIIYGLAIPDETCSQSQVCFRYALTDSLFKTTKDSPIKAHHHGIDVKTLSTREIEQGKVSLDLKYIVYWVGALAVLNLNNELKIENTNKALSYLNKITDELNINNQDVIKKKAFCFLYRGYLYQGLKEYEKALADYNKALELDEKYAVVYNNRGLVYKEVKEYEKALADYNKALELDEKYAVVYNNRGDVYQDKKEYEKALADFTKALEFDEKNAIIYANRGLVYQEVKDYEKALADYNKALELGEKDAIIYTKRGLVYQEVKDYEKALADLDKALELDEKYATAYNNRGSVYQEVKDYEKALADFTKALELGEKDAKVYNNRGLVYQEVKDYEKALADLDKALELDEKYATAYHNRSLVYQKVKEYEKALADLDKALELDEKDATTYNNRGSVYYDLKEYEKALINFDKAIELAEKQKNVTLVQTIKENKKRMLYKQKIEALGLSISTEEKSRFTKKEKGIFALILLVIFILLFRYFVFGRRK